MANSLRELLAELDAQNITGPLRYDRVRRFIAMKGRKNHTPVSGSFELTPLCNLDCKMCYVHLNKEQMQGTQLLPVETWIHIAQQAIDAGMLYAQITGGECLTYSHFKEFYQFLYSRGIEITLKTNGLLLSGELLQFLFDNPPSLISISIYGASDDGYEAVTGHRVFHPIMENIKKLQERKIPVSVSVTPSIYMKDGIEILHLLKEQNLVWNINPSLIHPRNDTARPLADASLETYANILKCSHILQGNELFPTHNYDALPEFGTNQEYSGSVNCDAGRSSFAINWKGELTPCINFTEIIYDIVNSSFHDAWKKIGYEVDSYPRPVECSDCAYQKNCSICVAAHISRAPKGHVNRAICEWNKFMISKGLIAFDHIAKEVKYNEKRIRETIC